MAIRFPCPDCGARYSVPEKLAGKKTTCVKCKRKLDVPVESTLSAEPSSTVSKKPAKVASVSVQGNGSNSEPPMAAPANGNPFDFFDGSDQPTATPTPKSKKKLKKSDPELEPEVLPDEKEPEDIPMEFVADDEPVPLEFLEDDDPVGDFGVPSSGIHVPSVQVQDGRKDIFARLPVKLVEAFAAHAAKERRTLEAEIEIAMEERLIKFDRWKPEE